MSWLEMVCLFWLLVVTFYHLVGNIHLINSVLIPSSVTLPSQRLSRGGWSGRRGENELFDF